MKKILICRHGKSSWEDPYLSDHDRPLAARGLINTKEMARRLLSRSIKPDLALSSDAKRARDTAFFTFDILGINKEKIEQHASLFHASANTILEHLQMISDHINIVFLYGHNPGFNELIWMLGGEIDNLPTAGQYGFNLKVNKWSEIHKDKAEHWFYDFPKNNIQNLRTS
ncbi:SixA phosphatase family protein [Anditalea andensis]|uniref:Phosphoglycerate mutase n=1 Tax=Anditalea andensis TaxID=1048983 RepID=A0A074L1T3_9BACT|nr:histidine phosphatase family protein [Anditalea andensis]KEO74455.1 phosphoglycerate mutase [Anditalea andensis]